MRKLRERDRAELEAIFERNGAVGASTATISGGVQVNREVFGLGDSRAGTPVDTGTRFQAASISKSVNAVAVLHLVGRGVISLDAPVNRYLTRWQLGGGYGGLVTVEQLLSHSGGTTVHGFRGYGASDPLPGVVDILNGTGAANSPAVSADSEPGKAYRYSGGGTTVLQLLVEDVTGSAYEDVLAETIVDPLGMTRTCFSTAIDSEGFSRGHDGRGNPVRGGYRRHPEKAAAGLWTTPSDPAKLLIDIFGSVHGHSTSILSGDLAARMISPVIDDSGLGAFLIGKDLIGHSSTNHGFRSCFVFNVRTGEDVVAMSNSERGARTPVQLIDAIEDQRGWTWS